MVSRNLTEVFVLMRNNAIHTRQIFTEQHGDSERVRLMRRSSHELEAGLNSQPDVPTPPPWTDALEEAHYVITRIRSKLSELESRHEKQLRRPALDEGAEQQRIGRLAAELGRLLTHAHSHIRAIRAHQDHGNKTEQKLAANVVLALVTTLQDLSVTFRMAQSNYLRSLTFREERSNAYFELPDFEELSLDDNADLMPGLTNNQTDLLFALPTTSSSQKAFTDENPDIVQQQQSQKQMLLLQEENTRMVTEREQEVNKIVRSIVDLNEIFKDLGQMVREQGSILDRIDYNIEQTSVQVHEGYKQLQKAEQYQKKNRKMHCILILAVTVIVLFALLIIIKS